MWNKPYSETDLVDRALEALGGRLPPSWKLEKVRREVRSGKAVWDAVVRLRGPGGVWSDLVLEVKRRIDPKDVLSLVEQLRRNSGGRAIWLVAPYLSPGTRELLKNVEAGFTDATGNMRLVLDKPGLFIETTGADRDPAPPTRLLASLKGRAGGRVVRALCDYKPPYGIRELAERSSTPLASVARVVALLERDAVVVRSNSGGVADADPDAIIRRWTQDYSLLKSNVAKSFLEPRDRPVLIAKLKGLKRYAVTGSLAASVRIPVLPGRLTVVYVDDIATAASTLGVRPTDDGANVFLLRPFDAVVYERGFTMNGVFYAAPSQVAADLLTSPGRGPADGMELLSWMKKNLDDWRV